LLLSCNPLQPPPESGLVSNWNGKPVAFFSSTSYFCANRSLYFVNNQSQTYWNMTCRPGGLWSVPAIWPTCLSSKISFFCKYLQGGGGPYFGPKISYSHLLLLKRIFSPSRDHADVYFWRIFLTFILRSPFAYNLLFHFSFLFIIPLFPFFR
jgi:hypothetical protein